MAQLNRPGQAPPLVPDLTHKPVNRSWRLSEARAYFAMALGGFAGSSVLHSRELPDDALFFRSIVWYTAAASVVCTLYFFAVVLVRRFPTARPSRIDGQPAVLLLTWPGRRWVHSALDLGLLALTGFWVYLAWNASLDRLFLIGLALVPFTYFAARWATKAAGRCRREALWVTETEIVHDSERGRARISRADVVRVQGWDDADEAGTDIMSVLSSAAARRSFGPPLLTMVRAPKSATQTSVDTTLMGHPAPEIAAWLSPPKAPVDSDAERAPRRWRLWRPRSG